MAAHYLFRGNNITFKQQRITPFTKQQRMQLPGDFETISLEGLNTKAPLLNREDRKFVFRTTQLDAILQATAKDYYMLEVDQEMIFSYRNQYYDTAGSEFYRQHHAGRNARCKVRIRTYGNSGLSFVEVKQKTNKGNTVKHRVRSADLTSVNSMIVEHTGYQSSELFPSLETNYDRITLLHKTQQEKVTLDLGLNYRSDQVSSKYEHIVIAEVKTEKSKTPQFCFIMKQHGIREGSLSKYCLGMISTGKCERYNNFKQQYLQILKTNHNE